MNTTLKAYLITAKRKEVVRNFVIIAYSKKEAGDLYVKWLKGKGWYEDTTIICVQNSRRSKRNKRFFSPAFYKAQCELVNQEYAKYMAKAGN